MNRFKPNSQITIGLSAVQSSTNAMKDMKQTEEVVTQLCVLQWIGRKESGANRIAQVRQSLYCHV